MQSIPDVVSPSQVPRPERQLPLRAVVAIPVLLLVTLACTLFRPASRSASERPAHLPTLTRTPLPTLTPTHTATPVAVARPIQAADATSSPATLPANELVEPGVPLAASLPEATVQSVSTESLRPAESADFPETSVASVGPARADPVTPSATAPLTTPPTATASATPLPPHTPTVTDTPLPTSTPTDTPTSTPIPEDWTFIGVQIYPDEYEDGLLLYGNLINNTGSPQEIKAVIGTFYDAQGKVIATSNNIFSYLPSYFVPAGRSLPFELIVEGVQNATNFDLGIEAEPSADTPSQDFEFLDVSQWNEDDYYCIAGRVRNLGSELQEYLLIAAILYDGQDNIINFGDYQEFGNIGLKGDEAEEFQICIGPPNEDVAHYDTQAWGR